MLLRNKISRCLCINSLKFQKHKYVFTTIKRSHSEQCMSLPKITIGLKENSEILNKFVNRTRTCGELTVNNVHEHVRLCGWLEYLRMGKFFTLRDAYGSTQCMIKEEQIDLLRILENLTYESVISVIGTVLPRPLEQCNKFMKTGDIEVEVDSLIVLNRAKETLPFSIRKYNKAKEALQMQYRYLALRFPEIQKNLRIRSSVIMKIREYLVYECGFIDVSTPTLFHKTPGGAQEFIVPTQHTGKCYSLVQSPQQFKQLLMVGGIDRYFQVAQCYRDEGSRNDRQPEFTQLDIEMSFVDQEGLMNMIENMIIYSWPKSLGQLHVPFQHLTYEQATETYGSDSPDLRIPGKIYNISEVTKNVDDNIDKSFMVYATSFKNKQQFLTKSIKEKLICLSKQVFQNAKFIQLKISDENLNELKNLFSKNTRKNILSILNLKENDVLLLTYGQKSDARLLLGKLRVEFVNWLESKGEFIRSSDYKFAWITDFPLFAINNNTKTLETLHHPFTQPHPEDMKHLFTNPLKVRGLQYDLVLNGSEIGGGSIRIHQKNLQEQILKMLKIDQSKIHYLLDALDSGAPPHGGIALGLDRYISIICGASSIREVIAFPKTIEGRDLMSGAPTEISEEDKSLYSIKVLNKNNNN